VSSERFSMRSRSSMRGGASPRRLRWPIVTYRGAPAYSVSALLVVGYYNTLNQFDRHVDEFAKLLDQISIRDGV
jgi:hypothetical protein